MRRTIRLQLRECSLGNTSSEETMLAQALQLDDSVFDQIHRIGLLWVGENHILIVEIHYLLQMVIILCCQSDGQQKEAYGEEVFHSNLFPGTFLILPFVKIR